MPITGSKLRYSFCLVIVTLFAVGLVGTALGAPGNGDVSIPDDIPTQNPDNVRISEGLQDRANQRTQNVGGDDSIQVIVQMDSLPDFQRDVFERSDSRRRQRVINALKDHSSKTQQPVIRLANAVDGIEVKNTFWITNAVVLSVDTDRIPLDTIARVQGVNRLHENYNIQIPGPSKGDRDELQSDSVTSSSSLNTTYGLSQINAPEVWSKYGTMGGGVKVAVLDSGVNVSHPDIDLYTGNASDPTYPGGWAEFNATGGRVA
ncbi:MAG: hypothetical protein SXQ77_07410, partial [Halobacteria archaeon]|nr:hypothetical protein [Halobacteria archaeon]